MGWKTFKYVCHLSGFLLSGHYCCFCCIWCYLGKLQGSEDKIWQFARKSQEICHNSRQYSSVLPYCYLNKNQIKHPMEKLYKRNEIHSQITWCPLSKYEFIIYDIFTIIYQSFTGFLRIVGRRHHTVSSSYWMLIK